MKKLLLILFLILLTACSKLKSKDIPISQVLEEIKVISEFKDAQTADLTNQKTASEYGIDPISITEGYAYYSAAEDSADMVIIARASSQSEVENVEKAISAKLTSESTAWKNNEKESEKIKNHTMRTIGDCILLAIGDKSSEIEQVFYQLKE